MRFKSLLFFIAVMMAFVSVFAAGARADTPLDQISVALLGHLETVVESNIHGKTNAALLATPIQIGKMQGDYIAGVDFGVLGNVKPNFIGEAGYNWTAGVHFHLSPLIRKVMPQISPNYQALAALEINPRVSYSFRNKTNDVRPGWQLGLGIGWSFSATPQK